MTVLARDGRVDTLAGHLASLDAGVDAATVVRAANRAGVAVAAAVLATSLVTGARVAGLVVAVGVGAGVRELGFVVPAVAARARRTRALGRVPALVARAVLRLRVEPTAEAAATFAARHGDGPLAASLAAHVRRERDRGRSGLEAFAADWDDPTLRRAVALVASAATAQPGERERALDRALETALDGTRDRAADAAVRLAGPVTALYAFGVLLPLALVAGLPAARVAGVPVSVAGVVAVYDLLLPVALAAAAAWLLARRPVAFPPTPVPSDHPEVPDGRWRGPLAGSAAAGVAVGCAVALGIGWLSPVVGVGAGVGAALVVHFRPSLAVRERVRAVEAGLPDVLFAVGREMRHGTAVERALAVAADATSGPASETFATGARRGRRLRVGVEEAFLGDGGTLEDLPSARTRSAVRLLAVAAHEGRPAGTALVELATHLDDLRSVEREARRELAAVTRTLANTGAVFAPLVAGGAVALAGRLAGSDLGGSLPLYSLGLAVGGYVLALGVVLPATTVALERGLDRTEVGYRVGVTLCSATVLFPTAFLAARFVA